MKKTYEITMFVEVEVEIDKTKAEEINLIENFSTNMWKVKDLEEIMQYMARCAAVDREDFLEMDYLDGIGDMKQIGGKVIIIKEDDGWIEEIKRD